MDPITLGLIMAGAGAGLGLYQNDQKQQREDKTRKANAAATEVSWARRDGKGNIPQIQYNDGTALGSAFQGGLGGFMQGYTLGGMGGAGGTTTPMGADGANALGGADMAKSLGDQSSAFSNSMANKSFMQSSTPSMQQVDWNSLQAPNLYSQAPKKDYGLGMNYGYSR